MSYYEIQNEDQYYHYLNTSVKELVINQTKGTFFLTSQLAIAFNTHIPRYLTIGTAQIRNVRTNYFQCKRYKSVANANTCLHYEYKGANIDTSTIGTGTEDWHTYKTPAQNNFSEIVEFV